MPEHQQIQQSKKPDTTFQEQATPVSRTPVSNPYSIIQRAKINPKSLTHADIMQLQRTIGNRAVGRLLSSIVNTSTAQQTSVQRQEIPEEEPLQGKFEIIQRQEIPEEEKPLQGKFESKPEIACPSCFAAPIVPRQELEDEEPLQGKMIELLQLQAIPEEEEPLQGKFTKTIQRQEIPEEEKPLQTKRENNTRMPDNLKAGVENLSGIDMSDVRVHYNSSKPAEVGALAYTQGTNIHVASGQERHLPHEAWHVVQQSQGRVKPTMQLKDGIAVNDDEGLEHEADKMGARAVQMRINKHDSRLDPAAHMLYQDKRKGGEVVQAYSKKSKPNAEKLSEEKNILLRGIQDLYATDSKVRDSNDQLKNAGPHGSMIMLTKVGQGEKNSQVPGKEFYKIKPAINTDAYFARLKSTPNTFHRGMNEQGESLKLWADCRRAAEVVTGASSPTYMDDKEVQVGKKTFGGYSGIIQRPSGTANQNKTSRLSMQVYAQAIIPFLQKYQTKALEEEEVLKLFPEVKQAQDPRSKLKEVAATASKDISVAERLYSSLKQEYKLEFHKLTKTNEFANPEIGDAYATVTEYGMPGFEESGNDWEFHWGGVVMKDGSDNVTIENFSVSDEKVRNSDWMFEMYGTENPEQSFHYKQTSSGHHGNIATTISVSTKGSVQNRLAQALKEIKYFNDAERYVRVDFRKEILVAAVRYNELADKCSKERITVAELLGRDRNFTAEDISTIPSSKKQYIPK